MSVSIFSNYYLYVIATSLVMGAVIALPCLDNIPVLGSVPMLNKLMCFLVYGMLMTLAILWIVESRKYTVANDQDIASDEKLVRNLTDLFLFITAIIVSLIAMGKAYFPGKNALQQIQNKLMGGLDM